MSTTTTAAAVNERFSNESVDRLTYLVRTGGNRLCPVGGRIVGDVLIGLLDRDRLSYRSVDPEWRPEFPTLAALLEFGAAASPAVR